ncbi:MAG: serine hydrolase [Candidatus Taylorbacteria bacterium]|nr:serine hydrolase [Candidatus Taylorbacteria bacterium]
MWKIYLTAVIIIVLFVINIFFVFKNSRIQLPISRLTSEYVGQERQAYVLPISGPNYIPVLDSNVLMPTIDAKSAVVFDTRSSRFLYEKNGKTKLPIASLTKVMSAVVVLENLAMNDIVTISGDSIKVDGEKHDLYLGEKMTVKNLLKLTLIESSNDAAYALASYAKSKGIDFVSAMNVKARALGMADSNFIDPAGLNDNAYSTVQDLLKLVQYSLNYQEIWDISAEKTAIVESSDEKIKHTARSTNLLIGLIKDLIGGKTGYTEGAGQCMILVTSVPDYPSKIVSIVLGSQDRFGDTQKLIDWTRRAYRWQ